ncbi:tetratricopeptide repeat protein [Lonepinella sp. BR2919]|uniref:tetratricopeptide repeat protein n=1 Tax=unclassified Lonepinella TaxID=2642006 RepID=UPI003F6DB666
MLNKLLLVSIISFSLTTVCANQSMSESETKAKTTSFIIDKANEGYPEAQWLLGYMYKTGDGLSQNYAQAVKWYRKAAEQGHRNAWIDLGTMYASGQGVSQDKDYAKHIFKTICDESGNDTACHNYRVLNK